MSLNVAKADRHMFDDFSKTLKAANKWTDTNTSSGGEDGNMGFESSGYDQGIKER